MSCQGNFLPPEEILKSLKDGLGLRVGVCVCFNCHVGEFCRSTSFAGCENGPNIVICNVSLDSFSQLQQKIH